MRKLAAGALSFSGAIFAANYILPLSFCLPLSVLCPALGLSLFLFRRKWLLGFEIGFISAAFALLVFNVHASATHLAAKELDGMEMEIEAVLLDYPRVYEDYCSVYIRLTGENTPNLKAVFYDNHMAIADARPGQSINLTARLRPADSRYGEDYDHYYSKDIYLIVNSRTEAKLSGEGGGISTLPVRLHRYIVNTVYAIFPEDTAHFMCSLMLGEKSGLYEDVALYTDMSRAGFMHIAAVSGMHIAFLVGFLRLILGSSRGSAAACIVLLWLFVLMTGGSPSAVRAGFMQSALLVAPLVRRENDPLTSLSAVLALVLLFNPYAAASVSLQLSFAAMAGIMCFTESIGRAMASLMSESAAERLRTPLGIAAMSLSVMVFTVPLMALHFGYVSVLSPLSNVLALWAVPLVFCGGFVSVAAAALLPVLGRAAAWLISWPARYIFLVSRMVSDIGFAVVYLDNVFMWGWLALSFAALAAMLFVKLPGGLRLAYPILMSAVLLAEALSLSGNYYRSDRGTVAVLDVGQGQSIACIEKNAAVLIDCGGKNTLENAGETAAAYLISRNIRQLDALVLTHLHSDHANGVRQLMELVDVKCIYMPKDPPDEEGLLGPILESAEKHGAEVRYVWGDWLQCFGGIKLQLYRPSTRGDANERGIMCRLSLDDWDMLITADASTAAENELIERLDLSGTELYIAGHHGSRHSSGQPLLEELGAGTALISVGYNNYGHPTHETLERLSAYGLDIYRTDLNKTIEIRP